jgi:hypothetical protein
LKPPDPQTKEPPTADARESEAEFRFGIGLIHHSYNPISLKLQPLGRNSFKLKGILKLKTIKAKSCHRIWSLNPDPRGNPFRLSDIIAWELTPDRPVPITARGRHEGAFVFTNGAGWEASSGETFSSSRDVEGFLRSQEVAA